MPTFSNDRRGETPWPQDLPCQASPSRLTIAICDGLWWNYIPPCGLSLCDMNLIGEDFLGYKTGHEP